MALALFFLSSGVSRAQIHDSDVEIYFRVGSSSYDPSFRGNAARLEEFSSRFRSLVESGTCVRYEVEISGSASPDGSMRLNRRLASERLGSARRALEGAGIDGSFLDSCFSVDSVSTVTDWSLVAELVSSSDDVPYGDEVLAVLNDGELDSSSKEFRLKRLHGGKPWRYLAEHVFPEWRCFHARVRCRTELSVDEVETPVLPVGIEPVASASIIAVPVSAPCRPSAVQAAASSDVRPAAQPAVQPAAQSGDWTRKLTVKTNAAALALLMGNAAVEVDLTRNLSVHVPVYYSALNYFTSTIKFRTFALQPELRWNFTRPAGLFAGAHFGMAYFNLAVDGNWRIQTHNGNEPLIGGGLSLGYRLPISRDRRWNVEFCIGAGAYRFNYDKFYNEPNGALAGSVSRTWFGVDNAAISFSYSFDLGRGGKRR